MRVRYVPIADGQRFSPVLKGWKFCCCDCGLTHVFDFHIDSDKAISIVARRDVRATAARRRKKAL